MREMKDGGVQWIGEIPEKWAIVSTKFLFTIISGATPESAKSENWDGNIRWITPADYKTKDVYVAVGRRNLTQMGFDSCSTNMVPTGSIIFSKRAPIGSVAINSADLCTNQGCLSCINKGTSFVKFYYYVMSIATEQYELLGSGTTFKEISAQSFSNFMLPVPSYEDQLAISEYLDMKCAQIDTLIANVQSQIEKLKAYKQSLITEVVTKGLDPSVPMKNSGVDVYPSVPEHWNVQKTLTTLTMPITDGPHTTPELLPEGIPFVSAEAVSCGNGGIDFDHIRGFISREFYDECSKKYVPQRDDIYMIKSGATTGRVSVVDTDRIFTIWSPLAVFRCNPDVVHFRFLYYFLQSSAYQRQVQFGWTYGTQQNIGMRTLERLKVFVPPLDEQYAITECLDAKCIQIDRLVAIKQAKIEKLEQYKKSLIYEYVTGKREVM